MMTHPAALLNDRPFRASFLVRNARLQTILASSKFRVPSGPAMIRAETEHILTTPEEVKLQYFVSRAGSGKRPVVILLHGWEGTVRSAYIQSTGEILFRSGFDIVRLHFRDHGDTHGLNREPFRSDRITEIADAVRIICEENPAVPVALIGFSLGGNFALRTAREFGNISPDNLGHVIGVCPLLDPARSTRIIDAIPWLRRYFMQKWFRGLRKKEAAFPDVYNLTDIYELPNCWDMTEALISRYSPYPTVEAYFDRYTITGNRMGAIQIPTTIITAADDPVIPSDDFRNLSLSPSTYLHMTDHGGHCGFIENWTLRSWINRVIPDLLMRALVNPSASE